MTDNQIAVQYLIRKLRWKYKNDTTHNDALNRIVWHSYPIVYPNREEQTDITRAINARHCRVRRTKKFIRAMLDCYHCIVFLTLTFTDDTLSSTSEATRKRYVKSFLKTHSLAYIANVDYGSEKHREHYHAVVSYSWDDVHLRMAEAKNDWKYGFSSVKLVQDYKNCPERLGKYINKLSNHANKVTAGAIFHSRATSSDDAVIKIGSYNFAGVDELPF